MSGGRRARHAAGAAASIVSEHARRKRWSVRIAIPLRPTCECWPVVAAAPVHHRICIECVVLLMSESV